MTRLRRAEPVQGRDRPWITALLRQDHEHLKGLFVAYEATDPLDVERRSRIVVHTAQALQLHSQTEDEVFYRALDAAPNARRVLQDARRDHADVTRVLMEISGTDPDSPDWGMRVDLVIQSVRNHILEEEELLFDLAHDHLTDDELEELGVQYRVRKDAIRSQLGIEQSPTL